MYKVDSILKHTQVVSMRAWRLGRDIYKEMNKQLDSRGSMKTNYELHTRLKWVESNVMQFASLDSLGRFTLESKAPREWTSKGFSPLHARILRMFDQFETKFHNCWFDNL